uniref:Retrovirus-related Pol polyprotein from transposon TNT 1-94-like beta-barrel domain-containing protein n=1 Tax=Kalanchoe fedtschenkoi TaxID=63787 RepID=A0A7N0ZSA5_KALFE
MLLKVLAKKQKVAGDNHKKCEIEDVFTSMYKDNAATYAHSSIGNASEFSSYTKLAIIKSIQTTDGTGQPVVSKGIINCTCLITLSNVLHTPSFPVNLLSIGVIILQ